jgi:hypothetical protein
VAAQVTSSATLLSDVSRIDHLDRDVQKTLVLVVLNVVLSGVFCELRQYLTLSRFTNTVSSFGAGI